MSANGEDSVDNCPLEEATDLQLEPMSGQNLPETVVHSALPVDYADKPQATEAPTSSRIRKQTEMGREYTRSVLIEQFNGWIRSFDIRLKKLNQAKVTCDQPHELRSVTKCLHEVFDSLTTCHDRLKRYVDQTEFDELEVKVKKRDQIIQDLNEDIAEIIKNLSLERASYVSSSSRTTSKSFRSKTSRHSTTSHLGEERIQQVGKAAALKVELDYEKQERELVNKLQELKKQKQIAALQARVVASKKAEAEEFGTFQHGMELPRKENCQEKEMRILSSIDVVSSHDIPVEKDNSNRLTDDIRKREQSSQVLNVGLARECRDSPHHVSTNMLAGENVEPSEDLPTVVTKFQIPQVKIDIFDGNVVYFPAWESAFDALIGNRIQCSKHKMNLLSQYLSGDPKELISGLLVHQSEEAYTLARLRLKSRYGNPSILCQAFIDKLSAWPKIGNNQSCELQRLSDFLIQVAEIKKVVNGLQILDFAPESSKIVQKLPGYLQNKWRHRVLEYKHKSGTSTYPPFQELVLFVETNADEANIPELKGLSGSASRQSPQGNKRDLKFQSRALVTTTEKYEVVGRVSCGYCNGRHHIDKCSKILEISHDERLRFLRNKGLCFSCGSSASHFSKECDQRIECRTCKRKHLTILHIDKQEEQLGRPAAQAHAFCTEVCEMFKESHGCDSSMILPVWVRLVGVEFAKEILCYCILDSQSNTCFISEELKEQLGAEGCQTKLTLSTVYKSNSIVDTTKINGLEVLSFDRKECIGLPPAYTRDCIPATRSQIPVPEVAKQWKHLFPIHNKIIPYQSKAKVGILIGSNVPGAIRPREIIAGKEREPYAQRSLLGWGIVGMVCRNSVNYQEGSSIVHKIRASPVVCTPAGVTGKGNNDKMRNTNFVLETQVKEVFSPQTVRQMMEIDFTESANVSKELSVEDRKFVKTLSENIYQQEDGHYVMPLPIRSEEVLLPNNKALAVKRALQLKRRFMKNARFKSDYMHFMDDVLAQYAERVSDVESSAAIGRINYVPHTGVYNSRKPNKIRIVFDCSAAYQGVSLNDHLLSGPNLTNGLIGIICRFRKEQVAMMMDIKAMFHQFLVREQDRDMLRFLWWEEGDTSKPLQEFRMKVHLFGATSSPGCANFGLKRAAEDGEAEFGHQVADFVRKDFYVDDGVTSVPTIKEAILLAHGSIALCKRAGLTLHKFLSNEREVLKAIPESKRADGLRSLDLLVDSLPVERALGIDWCVENDCFQFRICIKYQPITRRGILSTISSVYDPLGFIAPVILEGKKILQELCRNGMTWDDEVPENLSIRWKRWRTDLLELEKLRISRCFKPKHFGEVVKVELHHFSDASEEGYGQCSYLKLVNKKKQVHCSLVIGKARVTPLKQVSIPRLELTAALVSARMSAYLHHELKYPCLEDFFWVDSKVVLGYVNNEAKRFHTYVANRVQKIRDLTNPKSWRYVESKYNPSDEASRGIDASKFVQGSKWLRGPDFLWQESSPEFDEPFFYVSKDVNEEMKQEMRKTTTCLSTVGKDDETALKHFESNRLDRFSSWFRGIRAVAYCLLYIQKLKARVKQDQVCIAAQLSVSNLQEAENTILKCIQGEQFREEINNLTRNKEVKSSSSIFRLNPYIDDDGILRVGGRLGKSQLSDVEKHPAIIPKTSHITKLLITHYHEKCNHMGRGMTLNNLRQHGFWVIGGSSNVSRIIKDCILCKRLKGEPQSQRMADLPMDRVAETSPFTYSGMDVFGPFHIKERRSLLKRYGLIFTCLSSRAIHLESINSLDTSSFINGLRRFLARRGPILQLRCDCGTNFVGANNELQREFKLMDSNRINDFLLQQDCDWFSFKFNVPHSSHMGGVWERQIRTVRNALQPLVTRAGSQLDDESFRTFLTEVENIVNSRPLSVANINDPDCLQPLTPNHLLTMKPKILLPPPGSFPNADLYTRRRWRRVQHLANEFWFRWRRDYLDTLQPRSKWCSKRKNLQTGDIVILKEESPRNKWPLAKVIQVFPDDDNLVRKVKLLKADDCLDSKGKRLQGATYLERPIHKVIFLFSTSDDKDELPRSDSRRGASTQQNNFDEEL